MLTDFLLEYKDGLLDSVQGFLVLHKLDQTPAAGLSAAAGPQRASSAEPQPRMTILEKRRLEQKAEKRKSAAQPAVIRTKIPAYYRVLQCVGANVLSIVLLQLLVWITEWVFPEGYPWLRTLFSSFRLALIMPVFVVIRVLSTLWFADVASAAYRYRGAAAAGSQPIISSQTASDFLHAILVELVFLLQTLAVSTLPIPLLNHASFFLFMCCLHSLYSFEYVWMSRGRRMNSRIVLLERRWPYHVGFGTILTLMTTWSDNFVVNSCVFGALFPFFIVSSFLAEAATYKSSELPPLHLFHLAQLLTNKLSLAVFSRVRPVMMSSSSS